MPNVTTDRCRRELAQASPRFARNASQHTHPLLTDRGLISLVAQEQLEADQLAANEEDIASLQLMWFAELPKHTVYGIERPYLDAAQARGEPNVTSGQIRIIGKAAVGGSTQIAAFTAQGQHFTVATIAPQEHHATA